MACGRKTATSSAYDLYREWQEDLPQPGAYSVILDSAGRARCLIQTTKVYVTPFCQVRASHARMEGEGDGSLSYWRQVHRKFFAECLAEAGIDFTEDTKVVCEEFRLVYVPEKPITEKFDDNLKKGPGNGTEEEGI